MSDVRSVVAGAEATRRLKLKPALRWRRFILTANLFNDYQYLPRQPLCPGRRNGLFRFALRTQW